MARFTRRSTARRPARTGRAYSARSRPGGRARSRSNGGNRRRSAGAQTVRLQLQIVPQQTLAAQPFNQQVEVAKAKAKF